MNPSRLSRLRVDLQDAQDEGTPVKVRPIDLLELLQAFDEVRLLRVEKQNLERRNDQLFADRADYNKVIDTLNVRIGELEYQIEHPAHTDPDAFAKIGLDT